MTAAAYAVATSTVSFGKRVEIILERAASLETAERARDRAAHGVEGWRDPYVIEVTR